MWRSAKLFGAGALVALSACGDGESGFPFGGETVPSSTLSAPSSPSSDAPASTTEETSVESTLDSTVLPTTAPASTAAGPTVPGSTVSASMVPASTVPASTVPGSTVPVATTLPATTVDPATTTVVTTATTVDPATTTGVTTVTTLAPPTTIPVVTSPVTTIGVTTTTEALNAPALFVDLAATPGLEDVAGGAAAPVEQVATQLNAGQLVLPAGSRVLDVEITVNPGADPQRTDISSRTDRVRTVVATALPLEELRTRFEAALAGIAAYQPTQVPLAAPQVGLTISAASPTPDIPAWTITMLADPEAPGRWVIDVVRSYAAYPGSSDQIPAVVADRLIGPRMVLDALQWRIDSWYYRDVIDAASGLRVMSRRMGFASGTADPVEAAAAVGMSLPGAVREDLDADTAQFIALDGARWTIGEAGGTETLRGTVTLDG